jgi:hypothetical protein
MRPYRTVNVAAIARFSPGVAPRGFGSRGGCGSGGSGCGGGPPADRSAMGPTAMRSMFARSAPAVTLAGIGLKETRGECGPGCSGTCCAQRGGPRMASDSKGANFWRTPLATSASTAIPSERPPTRGTSDLPNEGLCVEFEPPAARARREAAEAARAREDDFCTACETEVGPFQLGECVTVRVPHARLGYRYTLGCVIHNLEEVPPYRERSRSLASFLDGDPSECVVGLAAGCTGSWMDPAWCHDGSVTCSISPARRTLVPARLVQTICGSAGPWRFRG